MMFFTDLRNTKGSLEKSHEFCFENTEFEVSTRYLSGFFP